MLYNNFTTLKIFFELNISYMHGIYMTYIYIFCEKIFFLYSNKNKMGLKCVNKNINIIIPLYREEYLVLED